jgi:hypothetical protein
MPGETNADHWWENAPYSWFAINSHRIRAVLEAHPEVKLVLSAHMHQPHWSKVNRINYLNLMALANGNYSVLDFFENGEFKVTGWGDAPYSYTRR